VLLAPLLSASASRWEAKLSLHLSSPSVPAYRVALGAIGIVIDASKRSLSPAARLGD
jgi:hypothetical protein